MLGVWALPPEEADPWRWPWGYLFRQQEGGARELSPGEAPAPGRPVQVRFEPPDWDDGEDPARV
jgi:hypothetical protein